MITADVLQEAEELSQDGKGKPPSFSNTCSLEDMLVKHSHLQYLLIFVNFCDNSELLIMCQYVSSNGSGNGSGAVVTTALFSDDGLVILLKRWLQILKMMEKLVDWELLWKASRRLKR